VRCLVGSEALRKPHRRKNACASNRSQSTRPRGASLSDLDHAKRAVLNSLGSAASARAYTHAIDDFIERYCSEPRMAFSKPVVLRYRIELVGRQLSASTINVRLGAVGRLAYEAADSVFSAPELEPWLALCLRRSRKLTR
jgi:hypothetical protein